MLFEKLKIQTLSQHKDIEQHVPILRPGFSREEYRAYLERLLGFYGPVEERFKNLDPAWVEALELEKRKKTHLLKSDIQALGGVPSSTSSLKEVPATDSAAQIVGLLYVLEGSTLGGQILKKRLKENLNLADDEMQFFSGYGPHTGSMWMKFKEKAEELVDVQAHDEVVASAQNTFECYKNWIARI